MAVYAAAADWSEPLNLNRFLRQVRIIKGVERGKITSMHRRKYSKDFKIELVESVLKGRSALELAKENDIYPPQSQPKFQRNVHENSIA